MTLPTNQLTIKQWSQDDQPREKLFNKGAYALSDAELLTILISTGTKKETALDISKNILNRYQNDFNRLGKVSVKELMNFNGIGLAKAITIIAALEIGRRRKDAKSEIKPTVKSSQDAFVQIIDVLQDKNQEEFWILLLNRANEIEAKINISKGGVAGTVIDNKIVFKHALDHLASSIVLVHNHPSGNITPSDADKQLTQKIVEAGKMLDITVVDHLIIGNQNYFSFADAGIL